MKDNGIIRRIDGLGRIVIPIHMRKQLNLFENDNVELCLNDKEIKVTKYSSLQGSGEIYSKICESLYKSIGGTILITDEEQILSSYGEKRNVYKPLLNLSSNLKIRLEKEFDVNKENYILNGVIENDNNLLVPIKGQMGKKIGSLIHIYKGNLLENNRIILYSYAIFIEEMLR